MDFKKKPLPPEQLRMQQAITALAGVRSASDFTRVLQDNPFMLEDSFHAGLQQVIAQARAAGNEPLAAVLSQRLEVLKDVQSTSLRQARQPFVDALMAFLQAANEEEARAVFVQHNALLAHQEAHRLLKEAFRTEDPASQERVSSRTALLEQLCDELAEARARQVKVGVFEKGWERYVAASQRAAENLGDRATWEEAVLAGEELLAPALEGTPGVDFPALRRHIASTHNGMGGIEMADSRWELALRCFDRAIALDPRDGQWAHNRAVALIELGRFEEAHKAAAAAISLAPEAEWVPHLRALLAERTSAT